MVDHFFEKQAKKGVFRHFFGKFLSKNYVFFARSPFKISIYWRRRRLQKTFRVRHQKWISQNSINGGRSAGGRITEGGVKSSDEPFS